MNFQKRYQPFFNIMAVLAIIFSSFGAQSSVLAGPAYAKPLPALPPVVNAPASVTIAGDLNTEMGCGADWDPTCAQAHLTYDATDDVWQGSWALPTGNFNYKAALNDAWTTSYPSNDVPLNLASPATVKFYYDDKSNWVADSVNKTIATAVGSFQSELGCPADWVPDCLRSWMQDVDGDGTYTYSTTAIPAGSYDWKVAINEGWGESYGADGVLGGANIPFTIPAPGYTVTFNYVNATHVPSITLKSPGPQLDNNVEWDGLRHDSRDLLYRTPGGAVAAGTPVTLRMRTFHNDVNIVKVRFYDINAAGQRIVGMSLAASDVSCYQAGLEASTCDYWEYTLPNTVPNNLWYRFIITDGTSTVYYGDNTAALDGGIGSPSNTPIDNSFSLMVYDPAFSAPSWAKNAVIYQIFPDRFRSGRNNNNPITGQNRYDDPVLKLPWNTLPEGYCRNYSDGNTNCPWRFDTTPPSWSLTKEAPRGRDYMGGDLTGVDQKLDYLKSLGVTTIYFNPIFNSASNHGYDTQDYRRIDPYFGTQKDWELLVKHAKQRNMNIVLDGVFNHMSSDSAFFDRYHQYPTVGACESASSPYRKWFTFRTPAAGEPSPCAPSTPGGTDTYYDGWFGFDSIPVLNKSNANVQKYFVTGGEIVTINWLIAGSAGWRLDVMGDSSFPAGYWENFRATVKETNPNALIIGELWQKDSTLLRFLRGDRADSTMNYRLRDAVIGLLTPAAFDSKGFADSGRQISPSEFVSRLASIREDYPDAAFYSLMNLMDSHDTERALWTLTPGQANTAEKENNTLNLAAGKQNLQLASLIQFTLPGAPTVYYGDEVGMTGADDPDDRRTYPWADLGGNPDTQMFTHYQTLASLRKANAALTSGDLRMLLADDTNETLAYGRKTTSQAALVVINRSTSARTVEIPLSGYVPDGMNFNALYGVGNSGALSATVTAGVLSVSLNPHSAWLMATGAVDLLPTAAPASLHVTSEDNNQVSLTWNAVSGANGYNFYHSPVSGGGWVKINTSPITSLVFTDTNLVNARNYYFVVRALDAAGNESAYSNQVKGMPNLTIGWANTQSPNTLIHTISVTNRTKNVFGQVWINSVTGSVGPTPSLTAQLGFGPVGSNPATNAAWIWEPATFNGDAGNNDEFVASLLPEAVGTFDYVYRYSTTNGRNWLYTDLNGPLSSGSLPSNPGKLTVSASADTTAPAVPTNLVLTTASPAAIGFTWDAVVGDASLYGYEILRSNTSGGPYTLVGRVTGTNFVDSNVVESTTYYYVVRSLDTSFNRSGNSAQLVEIAALRTVQLVFNVVVPATTDATTRSVYIAGFLDRLDGGLPQWNPGGVVLTRVDATHWTITLSGKENTQIEYKYALGSWDYAEKDNACGEVPNRQLTLAYGSTGSMTINDTVQNWRNVAPCGN